MNTFQVQALGVCLPLILLMVGCGGSGSEGTGSLIPLSPQSEGGPAPNAPEGIISDLPPLANESEDSVEPLTPLPSSSDSTPSSTPTAELSPQILSFAIPTTLIAGEDLFLEAEVHVPLGLQSIQIQVISPASPEIKFSLSPAEVGCQIGQVACQIQGTVSIPRSLTGTYDMALTVIDLEGKQVTQTASIIVR